MKTNINLLTFSVTVYVRSTNKENRKIIKKYRLDYDELRGDLYKTSLFFKGFCALDWEKEWVFMTDPVFFICVNSLFLVFLE